MPSGKKARGRQNRAKKEATRTARTADLRSMWEPTVLQNNVACSDAATSCEHRLAVIPQIPQVGPVVSFMNLIASEGLFNRATRITYSDPVELCVRSLSQFPEVVSKKSERSLAIDLLVRFVRNVFVHDAVVEGERWFHQHRLN